MPLGLHGMICVSLIVKKAPAARRRTFFYTIIVVGVVVMVESSRGGPSRLSEDAIAGAVAGASARMVTAPFDVLKIRFQLQSANKVKYTSMAQAFATVVKEEGLVGLWKGNLSATYLWISYAMVQFSVYGFLKTTLDRLPDPFYRDSAAVAGGSSSSSSGSSSSSSSSSSSRSASSMGTSRISEGTSRRSGAVGTAAANDDKPPKSKLWKAIMLFAAGAGAGISATSATYPFDIMRTQFAIQGKEKAFSSMHSFISHTFSTKGIRGFYAGLSPALVGIAPYMGLNFAIYETVKTFSESPIFTFNRQRTAQDDRSYGRILAGLFRKGACGAVAGGASKFIMYPLDTIKKRMQFQVLRNTLDGLGDVPKYANAWNCAARIYTEEGLRGFYRGIVPTVAKSVVATGVTFAAYEGVKDLLMLRRHERAAAAAVGKPVDAARSSPR